MMILRAYKPGKEEESAVILKDVIQPILTQELGYLDTLTFKLPPNNYRIKNEWIIETEDDIYSVKSIDDREYVAVQNTAGLDSKYYEHFREETKYAEQMLTEVLSGTGWTFSGAGPDFKRTADYEGHTALDLLYRICSIFRLEFWLNAKEKKVYIASKRGTYRKAYFSTELNLSQFQYSSSTYDLYTRLYAVGADGVTFADINDGKPYVENFAYTNQVISKLWQDERYSVKESLLEAATERLAQNCMPIVEYRFKVKDLSGEPKYEFLSYELGDTVDLLDRENDIRDQQRIIGHQVNLFDKESSEIKMATADSSYIRRIREVNLDRTELLETKIDNVYEAVAGDWTYLINERFTQAVSDAEAYADLITAALDDPESDVFASLRAKFFTVAKLQAAEIDAASIKTVILTADAIDAGMIKVNEALINKLLVDDLLAEKLYANTIIAKIVNAGYIEAEDIRLYDKYEDEEGYNVGERLTRLTGKGLQLSETIEVLEGESVQHEASIQQVFAELQVVDGRLSTTVTELGTLADTQLSMLQSQEAWQVVVQAIQQQTGSNTVTLGDVLKYMQFDDDFLTIGKTGSSLSIQITNEAVNFLDGGEKVAWISGQQLHIGSAVILKNLTVGNHIIEKYEVSGNSEDITIFRWANG